MDEIRVRFAPSPTGSLHVGGARTAIYNWAFAKNQGGRFILRIEDTDPERSTPENTQQIIRSLRWLGLDWDEGPEAGGGFGPYLQTERFEVYRAWLDKLVANDKAYPCFCTVDELKERREHVLQGQTADADDNKAPSGPLGYDRLCRGIDAASAAKRIEAGEPHTWRLKIPLSRDAVVFRDAVYGEISTPYQQMDDFILVRSDGTPTYNYACVVDDLEMHITHVIRGDDHISNTPKQILIYEALEAQAPNFAHLSMILGPDGSRLSKRHGATSVESYRDEGYLPEALMNYLALLGWSLDGETTLIDPKKLCESFSLDRVSRNSAIFDLAKLDWINASYIKSMGASVFARLYAEWLASVSHLDALSASIYDKLLSYGSLITESLEAIYPLVAERVKTFADIGPMISYLFSGDTVVLDEASIEKCLLVEGVDEALLAVSELIGDERQLWDHESIESALRALPDLIGIKTKTLFQAIRVAVCGNMVSPPLFESLEILGRQNSLARLQRAREIVEERLSK
ncbi:MAG: glutamate--tRNA ligase [Coriobacteriia bacterium]|nr:glutamate--tRNA ligase [Coriobacteriia bacterium]